MSASAARELARVGRPPAGSVRRSGRPVAGHLVDDGRARRRTPGRTAPARPWRRRRTAVRSRPAPPARRRVSSRAGTSRASRRRRRRCAGALDLEDDLGRCCVLAMTAWCPTSPTPSSGGGPRVAGCPGDQARGRRAWCSCSSPRRRRWRWSSRPRVPRRCRWPAGRSRSTRATSSATAGTWREIDRLVWVGHLEAVQHHRHRDQRRLPRGHLHLAHRRWPCATGSRRSARPSG